MYCRNKGQSSKEQRGFCLGNWGSTNWEIHYWRWVSRFEDCIPKRMFSIHICFFSVHCKWWLFQGFVLKVNIDKVYCNINMHMSAITW